MNVDYRVFDFVDEDEGNVKIQEREWIVKEGGLGWSFEERVELGDGLVDEIEELVLDQVRWIGGFMNGSKMKWIQQGIVLVFFSECLGIVE